MKRAGGQTAAADTIRILRNQDRAAEHLAIDPPLLK
jgi:hypothetical protein